MRVSFRKKHTREPLYSNSAVIAWWLQSTRAQKRKYFGQCFTSENIHRELLSLINPAVYLINKIVVVEALELCKKKVIFPEKEDERYFAYGL